MGKVVVIGLDGASPELMFGHWSSELPELAAIRQQGAFGQLRSTVPAITPPAWTAMLTGKNPGQFGFWSFSYRDSFAYTEDRLVNSSRIKSDTIYHLLSRQGKRVALINVPVTYPPVILPGGLCISSFLAPDTDCNFTHPKELKDWITKKHGQYILDASEQGYNFRQLDPKQVRDKIYAMDAQKFSLTRDIIEQNEHDLVFSVIMGTDRMAHLFFRYADRSHPYFKSDTAFQDSLQEHYQFCDREIGRIRRSLGPEDTLLVVSDHGTQSLKGRFNLNEWLRQKGYLKVSRLPVEPTSLKQLEVDWPNTTAWSTGFTEARIYLNLAGREKQGRVAAREYDRTLDRLSRELADIRDQDNRPIPLKTIKRQNIYSGPYAKYAPDLFVEMDQNAWANNPLLGYESLHSYHTPKGNDYGVHAPEGVFLATGRGVKPQTRPVSGISNYDIAPTILKFLDLPVPEDLDGRPIKL